MPLLFQYLLLGLVAMLAPTLQAGIVKLTTVDGVTVEGEITGWTAKMVVVRSEDETRSVNSEELLTVHFLKEQEAAIGAESHRWIELADGSRISFTQFVVRQRTATVVTSLSDDALKLPADQIRSVQFTAAGRDASDRSLSDLSGDLLVVVAKDSGDTETLVGLVGDVTPEQVEFTWEGDTIPVKLSKIAAIGFHRTESSEQLQPVCVLSLVDGSLVYVRVISLKDEILQVTTVGGLGLKFALDDVANADFSAGKLSYLSDLVPLKSSWTPLVALPTAAKTIRDFGLPRRDISFTGSPLTLSRRGDNGTDGTLDTFNKGLALRSRTQLEYRIPRNMRRFVATAGIDPETADQGNVLLRIEIDGQTAFEQIIDGRQPSVDIDLDIAGKQRLRIFVDYGENLDTGDRLHLVEARLVK